MGQGFGKQCNSEHEQGESLSVEQRAPLSYFSSTCQDCSTLFYKYILTIETIISNNHNLVIKHSCQKYTLSFILTDCSILWPSFHLLWDVQAGVPLPQRVHHLAPELQTCAGGRPEPRAVRAGRGEALLEEQELWVGGVVFWKPLVKVNTKRNIDSWPRFTRIMSLVVFYLTEIP